MRSENVDRVKKGLPLTMPLAILNGKMHRAWNSVAYYEANKDKINNKRRDKYLESKHKRR